MANEFKKECGLGMYWCNTDNKCKPIQEDATRILFFKISKDDFSALKTYLLFLSCMPEKVRGIKGHDIISSEIPVDMTIANILRTK